MQNELKFLLYISDDTDVNIDVVIRDETLCIMGYMNYSMWAYLLLTNI
ncbi:hypothetical protein JNUCC76_01515 [Leuconostoc sp. JNUCC 76]